MAYFPAKITQDGKYFVVTFRDFEGCDAVAPALSYDEAIAMGQDWLACQAEVANERCDGLPLPSDAEPGEVLICLKEGVDWEQPVQIDALEKDLQTLGKDACCISESC